MAKIYVTSVISAPVDKIWALVRDFNSLPKWHPFIADSAIEEGLPSVSVGCIRNFNLKDGGGNIRERLLALSDVDCSCTYSILVAPIPVENYVATVSFIPVTTAPNQTLGVWTATFTSPADKEAGAIEIVTSVFENGFAGLSKLLG